MRFLPPAALLFFSLAPAQEFLIEPRLAVGSDFQAGIRAGAGGFLPNGSLVIGFLDAELRPFAHAVRVRESPTFSYQYREIRFGIGPGVSWAHPLGNGFAATISAGVLYSDGTYWGSNRDPASGWVGWLDGGFRYMLTDDSYCGLEYQYHPLPGISPSRVLLQYGWRFR
jgi:hypothetical protein